MYTFVLVYQAGIANVFREEGKSRRVYQGDFRTAEAICYGAELAGGTVVVMHYEMAGDALLAGKHGLPEWKPGKGSLFAESKHPRQGWGNAELEDEDNACVLAGLIEEPEEG